MSAVARPESAPLTSWSADAHQVDSLLRLLPAIDLATLEEGAALLTRFDRKYVVRLATLERLVAELGEDWRALEIEGRRLFGYTSTYFDTPDLATYRAHLQGRRRRFKVRIRRYDDTDSCMLEVKRAGRRGATVKKRTPHPEWLPAELGEAGTEFVDRCVGGHAARPAGVFRPVVTTRNHRGTLVNLGTRSRLTVDVDLRCGREDRALDLREGFVVLESKASGATSEVDRVLRRLGERPAVISKYCIGIASLGLDVPTNPWRRTVHRYFDTPETEEHPCP